MKTKLAKRIVEHCLKWVDKGRFSGRGKERKLYFPSLVNMRTGKVTSIESRMISDVATMLEEEINP